MLYRLCKYGATLKRKNRRFLLFLLSRYQYTDSKPFTMYLATEVCFSQLSCLFTHLAGFSFKNKTSLLPFNHWLKTLKCLGVSYACGAAKVEQGCR